MASIISGDWSNGRRTRELVENGEIEAAERVIKRMVKDACNNAMKRVKGTNTRKSAYWWSADIAQGRDRCRMWRRRLLRAKSRQNDEQVTQLAGELRKSRKELRKMIGLAKKNAWDELLEGLNRDPWGRPYKMVINKMKESDCNVCEKLPVEVVEDIIRELLPKDRGKNRYYGGRGISREEMIPEITGEEFEGIIKNMKKKGNKAPGPDGVQMRLVVEAQRCAEATYRGLYDGCLRSGIFPRRWKEARIVLLKKEGKPDRVASSYRPLCLLNETGKTMERIIKGRMEEHMRREEGSKLSKNQYGFRKGKSTVEAVMKFKEIVQDKQGRGLEVLAINLDIKNAFNSIE